MKFRIGGWHCRTTSSGLATGSAGDADRLTPCWVTQIEQDQPQSNVYRMGPKGKVTDEKGKLAEGKTTTDAQAGALQYETRSMSEYAQAQRSHPMHRKESEGLRIKKLISGIELGDMKPSQLLQKLRSLTTPDISDNLIKILWLDELSTSIKNILILSNEEISKLAIMVDKINKINSSKEIYDAEVPSSSTDRLIAKLEDLERQVSELRLDNSRSRYKTRTQLRPRNPSIQEENIAITIFALVLIACKINAGLRAVAKSRNSSAGIQDCGNLRLFVTDKNTGLRFLVDSGADISIIPPKDKSRMPSSDYKLYAANGTEIVTYGTKV
ncbi:hypothetical protein LAZ67_3005856 [Cordylochernes scorpioides]|uniref:Peptidase A2 domain-containing protein n=1 Tax=Cordylochernes scorpioides TaxID=51811 RepID=A0ABY6KBI1_9ARAC|nr:hypothetical protein LAZ67_3005856 [Cordylochernes scorpioides]